MDEPVGKENLKWYSLDLNSKNKWEFNPDKGLWKHPFIHNCLQEYTCVYPGIMYELEKRVQ